MSTTNSLKSERIAVRVSKEDKDSIYSYCKCKRYAVGDFLRVLAMEYIEKHPLTDEEKQRERY